MKTKPKVSIITPSFNQGEFIRETIESVLTQDYENIEYIVVDGASTDGTVDILKGYGDRIKWISEPDQGQSDALIKGFRISTGEILAWINSDDYYLPGAVAKAVNSLGKDRALGMVYGIGYNVDSKGNVIEAYPTESFDLGRLALFNYITQPAAFFRREAYFSVGGVDRSLHYTMDYDLWMSIGRDFKVMHLPEFFSATRLHPGAKTIGEEHALNQQEESLRTVMNHYDWAPLKSVLVLTHLRLKAGVPACPGFLEPLIWTAAVLGALPRYIRLNRGIRLADIRTLGAANIVKFIRGGWHSREMVDSKGEKGQ